MKNRRGLFSNENQQGLIGWIVLAALALLIIFGGLALLDSYDSIPGDKSYPVKQFSESLKIAINELNFESRALVYLEASEERLNELIELVKRRDRDKEILETLNRLKDQQTKAITNIERARGKGTDINGLLKRLETLLQKEQEVFPELSFQVIGESAEALQVAQSDIVDIQSRIDFLRGSR